MKKREEKARLKAEQDAAKKKQERNRRDGREKKQNKIRLS